MPARKEHIVATCLLIINTMSLHTASSLSVTTSPESFVLGGNPWGVTFEETIATGFALERVELLPNQIWEITARLSIYDTVAYTDTKTSTTRVPVIFIAPPGSVIPIVNDKVRSFLKSNVSPHYENAPWILEERVYDLDDFTHAPPYRFLTGNFSYSDIPSKQTIRDTLITPEVTTRVSLTVQHPLIDDVSMVRITIPHTAVKLLSPEFGDSKSMDIIVGVALLSPTAFDTSLDRIYSGVVRLSDIIHTPIVRSFTAVTSTRYTFVTQTTVQIVETLLDNVWNYVAVITFGLQDGVTSPIFDLSRSFFAIATSISTSDASMWKPIRCPSAPIPYLNGCAMDIFPLNAPFCTVETIVVAVDTPLVYRIRVQLGEYASKPSPSDNIFIRMLVEGLDNDFSKTQSFMNIQTRLLASSIRCGAIIVREPSSTDPIAGENYLNTDPVKMSTYSGITLVPMTQDGRDAPLIESTIAYPITLSSVSNLHARSIIDSLVTIALIGIDAAFPPLSTQKVVMVDLVSVHVRDDAVYDILNSMVRTGVAYSVNFITKQLTTSEEFKLVCTANPDVCAQRMLIRNGVLLQPDHAHMDTSITVDTEWIDTLFNDYETDKNIASTFTKNVYNAIKPNTIYRRMVWVDSTYTWPPTKFEALKDRVLILASFNVK
jgi:hypothetical protein